MCVHSRSMCPFVWVLGPGYLLRLLFVGFTCLDRMLYVELFKQSRRRGDTESLWALCPATPGHCCSRKLYCFVLPFQAQTLILGRVFSFRLLTKAK